MAIGFVAAADLGNNGGSSNSLTAAYTVGSGSNRLLIVQFQGDVSNGVDDITGVTYNGVAMTLVAKLAGDGGALGRWLYMYYLLNPDSGSNNVVITASSTHFILALAADYDGTAQTGQPDASSSSHQASGATLTGSITTIADNCWIIGAARSSSGPVNGTIGFTRRILEATFTSAGIFDTDAALSPAGLYSPSIGDFGTTGATSMILASFAPAGAAPAVVGSYYYRQVAGM